MCTFNLNYTVCMCMIFWAFMKVGSASRHVVTLGVKNLCPGIRVRLATPLHLTIIAIVELLKERETTIYSSSMIT